ncbi:MAG TPA: Asp-tRNA(Asn)/Glu-tRNA(Gln) amidotransferase subunit GatC [Candidatus Paceibacterota bacterium]|nr:Asp-tRNA(Asn)/Glu-tRNA(Gln) amidotransferase subunit GatC [Candidatus Paceibacterota bacterium]
MSSEINKQELERLAKLARLSLTPHEEEKFVKDLGAILDHFKELQSLDTAKVEPMSGGTDLSNVFRDDAERENTNRGAGTEAFPKKENGYLKIPPVFEQ